MEAETCMARGIDNVAFLDPNNRVNQDTCNKINVNPLDLIEDVTQIFLNCEGVPCILLAYYCEYVILALLNLLF